MPSFTLTKDAVEKKRLPADEAKKRGPLVIYTIELRDEGRVVQAEMMQKPESPAPKAGDVLEGTLTTSGFGMKFKRDKPAFGGKGGGKSPAERAEIRRMASHKVAVELLGIEVQVALARIARGEESSLLEKITNAGASTVLPKRIEWFEGDAKAAGDRA